MGPRVGPGKEGCGSREAKLPMGQTTRLNRRFVIVFVRSYLSKDVPTIKMSISCQIYLDHAVNSDNTFVGPRGL